MVIQVYITNAYRAYQIADHYRARGAYVALGGLHVTSLPDEAARPRRLDLPRARAKHTFPQFLRDLAAGAPQRRYESPVRTLEGIPPIRRDLIQRHRYLVPNSIVVSRGCPHHCTFCYKDGFFAGGRSFYTQRVDDALAEIARLPGRHLYFLDDHLFGNPPFARDLFQRHARHGSRLSGRRHRGLDPARRPRSKTPRPPGCAACSSASRRCRRAASQAPASGRTSAATTARWSGGSTISAS